MMCPTFSNSPGAGLKVVNTRRKLVSLLWIVAVCSLENAEIEGKFASTGLRNVSNAMGIRMVEKLMVVMGAMPAMVAPTRRAVFVE